MTFWKQNITTKVPSAFLLLSLITVAVVGGVAFVRAREALKQAAFDRLNVSATLKEQEISRWFEDQQRDFFLITKFPDIQNNLAQILNPADTSDSRGEQQRQDAYTTLSEQLISIAKVKPNLSEIFVLDRRNRIVVSTNKAKEGQYAVLASVTYLKKIEPGATFDPIFYVSLTTGKPAVTLAAPLINREGTRDGAILAHLNLDQIDQIIRERTGLGNSGETYLVGSLVNEFTFISREAPSGEQFSREISSQGIDAAMQGRRGYGLYRNYANVPVVGVYRWLNAQDIALLVEMQQEEAFAPARQLAGSITLVGLVSSVALALGVQWLARRLQQSQEQLERYSHQLEQKAQEADAANRSKSEFLANMSHELRTPLNAILGFTQLMSRDAMTSAAQLKQLQIINRSGEHLLTLINDVLEMSKIEAGKTALNENSFSLYQLLDSLEEMFLLKATAKHIQLRFERDGNVPEYVLADEGKLRQILTNLIGNAIKFTKIGRVTVRTEIVSAAIALDQTTQSIRFRVEDTGPGIAAHELQYVFEPFIQTESGRASKQGTGLGLPISKKFVELMGGTIQVGSALGQGSIFSFSIQVHPATPQDTVPNLPARSVIGLAPNQPQYRILIVEDRWENRHLLVSILMPMGFEIREAENGEEAIALWESWEPNLIWMDMRMPVMDGYEATKHIRSHLKGQATVIIALTASAFEESRSIILAAGCNDFVRKPFQTQVIFEKIAQYLGVTYLYADDVPEAQRKPQSAVAATSQPTMLSMMPREWVEQLHQAATKVNSKEVYRLIQHIPAEHADLADQLTQLLEGFQFEEIVAITQS